MADQDPLAQRLAARFALQMQREAEERARLIHEIATLETYAAGLQAENAELQAQLAAAQQPPTANDPRG